MTSDPREDEASDEPEDSEPPEDVTDDEIPLHIADHEDREPPSAADDGLGLASDADDADDVDDADGADDAGDADGTDDAGDADGTDDADDPDSTDGADSADDANDDADLSGTVETDDVHPAEPADGDDDPDALDHGPYPEDVDSESEDDEEVEPIELLVQLAKEGEIDPWDVDVVAVTEEFLAALEEGDLRQSGRALFYASVLVRMKSDVLLEDPEQEPEDEPWDAPMEAPEDAPPAFDPVVSLEEEMERRLQRKHVRGTPETLDELVRDLREAERGSWWKESREYDTSGSPSGFDRGTQTVDYHADDTRRRDGEPTAGEVTERTHGADIEGVIDDVRATLTEHYDAGRPEVLFREVEDAGGSRVQTFLAILFLANRGEVRLQQDELFGDLWIQDPTAELGVEGAVAD